VAADREESAPYEQLWHIAGKTANSTLRRRVIPAPRVDFDEALEFPHGQRARGLVSETDRAPSPCAREMDAGEREVVEGSHCPRRAACSAIGRRLTNVCIMIAILEIARVTASALHREGEERR
jgi:hypothetical protein